MESSSHVFRFLFDRVAARSSHLMLGRSRLIVVIIIYVSMDVKHFQRYMFSSSSLLVTQYFQWCHIFSYPVLVHFFMQCSSLPLSKHYFLELFVKLCRHCFNFHYLLNGDYRTHISDDAPDPISASSQLSKLCQW